MAIYFVTAGLSRSRTRQIIVGVGISLGAGILLALLGPFGTFSAVGIGMRLVYWVGLMLGGYLIYAPVTMVGIALSRSLKLPAPAMIMACSVISSLPMTFVVWRTNEIVSGIVDVQPTMPTVELFFELYSYVVIIGLGMTALFWWIAVRYDLNEDRADENIQTAPHAVRPQASGLGSEAVLESAAEMPNGPAILGRLPIDHDGMIHALESEDHYVRVHGEGRSDLILMRLADAVQEMDGVEGMRTHRSWWAARGAVESVDREGRTATLRLVNGMEVPVSRNNLADLKAAGWF